MAVTLAGASTSVGVAAEGVLAWPTIGLAASEISENLDPGVAQAIVMSRDGLHAAASVLLGISLLVVARLLTRSDLWGHWLLAAVGFLAGVSVCSAMIVGPEGIGPGAILIWGIVVALVILIGLRRPAGRRSPQPPKQDPQAHRPSTPPHLKSPPRHDSRDDRPLPEGVRTIDMCSEQPSVQSRRATAVQSRTGQSYRRCSNARRNVSPAASSAPESPTRRKQNQKTDSKCLSKIGAKSLG